jgi:zinc transport system ATP-binding protein
MEKTEKKCVEFSKVNFNYGNIKALTDISFNIEYGDYLGIVGPNGGGKSTLLKLMLGLEKPSSGKIKIFGAPIEKFKAKQLIGYVPQKATQGELQFPATVYEVVKSGRTPKIGLFNRFTGGDLHVIDHAMKIADVSRIKHKQIGELSGGQRQRVYIARALSAGPKILILDEPTVGVDVSAQEKFYGFLEELNSKYGITIIFVSHDIDFVANAVKKVLCLNQSLVCLKSPKDFLQGGYMEKIYGKNVKFVLHKHS